MPRLVAGEHASVEKCAFRARLQDVEAHRLRHSFSKNQVDAGESQDQVATFLGHESLAATKIYPQPNERDHERALKKAAGIVGNRLLNVTIYVLSVSPRQKFPLAAPFPERLGLIRL